MESPRQLSRTRTQRSFPGATFEDALELARQIQRMGSNKVRRLTLFDEMKKSPHSGASRQLITNSNRYGITKGSYAAEFLELTEDGQAVVSPETAPKEKARATFRLAIDGVPPFKAIYEEYAGKRLPSPSVVKDFLLEAGYADEDSHCDSQPHGRGRHSSPPRSTQSEPCTRARLTAPSRSDAPHTTTSVDNPQPHAISFTAPHQQRTRPQPHPARQRPAQTETPKATSVDRG